MNHTTCNSMQLYEHIHISILPCLNYYEAPNIGVHTFQIPFQTQFSIFFPKFKISFHYKDSLSKSELK